ncbi:hypothetical protein [Actinoplanes sp. NPDC026623]|uniref:hypothetical protein n=1 Tax=Actinoplanes sp. NPDC026623 TaxID=3155610 RepID=UPI0033E33F91
MGLAGSDRRYPRRLAEIFRLHAARRARVRYAARPLDDVNEGIEDMPAGRAAAGMALLP